MAAGDVFADMAVVVAAGNVDVQPAVGVQACITFIGGDTLAASYAGFSSKNVTTGNVISRFEVGAAGGNDKTVETRRMVNTYNMKLFITNTQILRLHMAGAGTANMAYSGIEI